MKMTLTVLAFVVLSGLVSAQMKPPLVPAEAISLPVLQEGDFDHFAVDLDGRRLFLAAEKNAAVEIFDLKSNKLIHALTDLDEPHSMLFRGDLKKLFVVDGGAGQVKIYQGDTYERLGEIKLEDDADSLAYDPTTSLLYVVNGGKGAKQNFTLLSILDTNAGKKVADIKIDSDSVEAVALEKGGPRMFVNITGKDAVGVFDRVKRIQIAVWPIGHVAKHNVAMALDESSHRLFVSTRQPDMFLVLNSDSGAIVANYPTTPMVDDLAFDPASQRIYMPGNGFVDVFQKKDADHYELLAHVNGAFRAKTGLLVQQWKRYFLAVPRHGNQTAEVRIFEVQP
jgi:DNA-binding beta-propeller fold protein YncE